MSIPGTAVRIEGMTKTETLLAGIGLGESPRWHDNRLWFCDWTAQEIVAVDVRGAREKVMDFPGMLPFCIDWLPDGRMLVVDGQESLVLSREPDGSLATYADLTGIDKVFNEIVVDSRGHAYVNGGGLDRMFGNEAARGVIALVTPDGKARRVAGDIDFGNGMAVTPDGSTLIVAESYGSRLTAFDIEDDGALSNRRVWADLGGDYPDGICLDAEGAVWYGSVPNKRCVRVHEGGEVLETIDLDRGCFACALGGPDGRTLFMLAAQWHGMDRMDGHARTGQLLSRRIRDGA
jgi:sugar lactone lactonase YvrE